MILNKYPIEQSAITQADPLLIVSMRPIFRSGHQPGPDRIQMDIPAQNHQIFPRIHARMPKAPFKQRTAAPLLQIQCLDISIKYNLHKPGQGFFSFLSQQKMIMISRPAIIYVIILTGCKIVIAIRH
jgi:hypothetical protein